MKKIIFLLTLLLLGFQAFAEGADPSEEKMMQELKLRRTMLDWHRYTAWATVGLMGATLATAPSHSISNTHKTLGILSGVGYLSSASLAFLAPKPEGTAQEKNIIIHKNLAWIHAPAFLLTVMSGLEAHKQRKDGKSLSGLAKAHSTFVGITAVSFGAAAVLSTDWSLYFLPSSTKDVACVFSRSF